MKPALVAALWLAFAGPSAAWTWLSAPLEPAPKAEAEAEADLAVDDQAENYNDLAEPMSGIHAAAATADGQCLAAIFAAQNRYDIPGNLLLALGLQEAGWKGPRGLTIWPYSVNAAGEGRRFNSRFEAESFVQRKRAQGVSSIDVGCLQINLQWHPDAFASVAQGFDPARNVDYAARFLRNLYEESGDWWLAAGRYHSRSSTPQGIYLRQLRQNLQVAQTRAETFAAMAASAGAGAGSFSGGQSDFDYDLAAADPLPEPPNYRESGPIWGAAIAGDEGARRTLYSNADIEPILPDFLPPET